MICSWHQCSFDWSGLDCGAQRLFEQLSSLRIKECQALRCLPLAYVTVSIVNRRERLSVALPLLAYELTNVDP